MGMLPISSVTPFDMFTDITSLTIENATYEFSASNKTTYDIRNNRPTNKLTAGLSDIKSRVHRTFASSPDLDIPYAPYYTKMVDISVMAFACNRIDPSCISSLFFTHCISGII